MPLLLPPCHRSHFKAARGLLPAGGGPPRDPCSCPSVPPPTPSQVPISRLQGAFFLQEGGSLGTPSLSFLVPLLLRHPVTGSHFKAAGGLLPTGGGQHEDPSSCFLVPLLLSLHRSPFQGCRGLSSYLAREPLFLFLSAPPLLRYRFLFQSCWGPSFFQKGGSLGTPSTSFSVPFVLPLSQVPISRLQGAFFLQEGGSLGTPSSSATEMLRSLAALRLGAAPTLRVAKHRVLGKHSGNVIQVSHMPTTIN